MPSIANSSSKQLEETNVSKLKLLVNVAETVNNNNSNNSSFTSGSVETNNVSEIPRTPPPASFIATRKTRSLRTGILPLIAIPFRNNRIYAIVGDSWGYHLDFTAGSCNIDKGESLVQGATRESLEETRDTLKFFSRIPKDIKEELEEMWKEEPFEPISDCYGLAHVRSVCFEDDTHVREQVLFLANVCDPPSIRRKPIDAEHFISEVMDEVENNKKSASKNKKRNDNVSDPVLPCPMINRIFNERHVCVERSREALEHNHFVMVPVYPPLSPAETEIVSRKYFCTHYFATQQQKENLQKRMTVFFSTLQQAAPVVQKLIAERKNKIANSKKNILVNLNKNNNNNDDDNGNNQNNNHEENKIHSCSSSSPFASFYTPITWSIHNFALRRRDHEFWGKADYGKTVKTCAICNAQNVFVFNQDQYCSPECLPQGYVSKVSLDNYRYFAIEISDSQTDKVVGVCHPRFTPVQDFEQEDRTRGFWINFVGIDASILKQCLRVPVFYMSSNNNINMLIVKDLEFNKTLFLKLVCFVAASNKQRQQQQLVLPMPKSQQPVVVKNRKANDNDDDEISSTADESTACSVTSEDDY